MIGRAADRAPHGGRWRYIAVHAAWSPPNPWAFLGAPPFLAFFWIATCLAFLWIAILGLFFGLRSQSESKNEGKINVGLERLHSNFLGFLVSCACSSDILECLKCLITRVSNHGGKIRDVEITKLEKLVKEQIETKGHDTTR